MDLFLNNDSFITIDLDPEDSDGAPARTDSPEAGSVHVVIPMQSDAGTEATEIVEEAAETGSVPAPAVEADAESGGEAVAVEERIDVEPAAIEAAEDVEDVEPAASIEPVGDDEHDEAVESAEAVESIEPVEDVEDVEPAEPVEPIVPVVNPRRVPRINPVDLDSEVDKYEMYQDAVSSSNTLGVGLVILMFVIAIMMAMWVGFGFVADQAKEQGALTLHDSIMDTAMQCFAIEGSYPPSLEYLQDNYGLSVNEEAYKVVYVARENNELPMVDVRLR